MRESAVALLAVLSLVVSFGNGFSPHQGNNGGFKRPDRNFEISYREDKDAVGQEFWTWEQSKDVDTKVTTTPRQGKRKNGHRTLYEILHVSATATELELKLSFQNQRLLLMLDEKGDDHQQQKAELHHAWKVLGNSKSRKQYDLYLQARLFAKKAQAWTFQTLQQATPVVSAVMERAMDRILLDTEERIVLQAARLTITELKALDRPDDAKVLPRQAFKMSLLESKRSLETGTKGITENENSNGKMEEGLRPKISVTSPRAPLPLSIIWDETTNVKRPDTAAKYVRPKVAPLSPPTATKQTPSPDSSKSQNQGASKTIVATALNEKMVANAMRQNVSPAGTHSYKKDVLDNAIASSTVAPSNEDEAVLVEAKIVANVAKAQLEIVRDRFTTLRKAKADAKERRDQALLQAEIVAKVALEAKQKAEMEARIVADIAKEKAEELKAMLQQHQQDGHQDNMKLASIEREARITAEIAEEKERDLNHLQDILLEKQAQVKDISATHTPLNDVERELDNEVQPGEAVVPTKEEVTTKIQPSLGSDNTRMSTSPPSEKKYESVQATQTTAAVVAAKEGMTMIGDAVDEESKTKQVVEEFASSVVEKNQKTRDLAAARFQSIEQKPTGATSKGFSTAPTRMKETANTTNENKSSHEGNVQIASRPSKRRKDVNEDLLKDMKVVNVYKEMDPTETHARKKTARPSPAKRKPPNRARVATQTVHPPRHEKHDSVFNKNVHPRKRSVREFTDAEIIDRKQQPLVSDGNVFRPRREHANGRSTFVMVDEDNNRGYFGPDVREDEAWGMSHGWDQFMDAFYTDVTNEEPVYMETDHYVDADGLYRQHQEDDGFGARQYAPRSGGSYGSRRQETYCAMQIMDHNWFDARRKMFPTPRL